MTSNYSKWNCKAIQCEFSKFSDNVFWRNVSNGNLNVAGTTANGVNAANVDILWSTDSGNTWTTLLSRNSKRWFSSGDDSKCFHNDRKNYGKRF
ncbi:hypothetical protein [Chryseobacterium indoltheticum]|uniref:hypothetical protein n=1 Tax=Chryseobacterium indoltheticum TaxID=254 RepID=UPI003F4949DE